MPLTTVSREVDLPPAHSPLGGIWCTSYPLKGYRLISLGQQIDDLKQLRDPLKELC